MRVSFATLGCKVNQYETQALKEIFKKEGYEIVAEDESAEVCIINTCSVTNMADRKSRQAIRHMKKLNPDCIIAVTGCYAQIGKAAVGNMQEVDIVAGTNEKSRLEEFVRAFTDNKKRVFAVREYKELRGFDEMGTVEAMEGRTRAYIKIQEGCNRFCAYCIIPYSRGNIRSRAEEDILKEARALIAAGYKELVLTGINTALYGCEDGNEPKLHSLIEKISEIEGEFRIRLSSLEPNVINAEYIKKLFKYDKLCHHVHLSVQSGSDRILSRMNRRYDMQEYKSIVNVISEFDENYGISTDIIVGFPGESQADFEESVKATEEIGFCRVHVFKYSKRGGTAAEKMQEHISSAEKSIRSEILIKAAEEAGTRFIQKNLGSSRRVLFEEYNEELGMATGLTDNYIKVYVEIEKDKSSSIINSFENVLLKDRFLDGIKGILL